MDERKAYEAGHWNDWCHYHNRLECNRKSAHAVCLECGHVYRTEKELRKTFDRYIVGVSRFWPFRKPSTYKIWVCPLCGHDF